MVGVSTRRWGVGAVGRLRAVLPSSSFHSWPAFRIRRSPAILGLSVRNLRRPVSLRCHLLARRATLPCGHDVRGNVSVLLPLRRFDHSRNVAIQ